MEYKESKLGVLSDNTFELHASGTQAIQTGKIDTAYVCVCVHLYFFHDKHKMHKCLVIYLKGAAVVKIW